MRTLTSIPGNTQKLDGGAMFGNAPKALWTRWIEPDAHNRIPLACRALLVREPGRGPGGRERRVLCETGIGAFFEPKLKDRYGVVEDEHVLLRSLAAEGLSDADIDVVVLSHLHFDHAGGLLSAYVEGEAPTLLFPNATYLVGAAHYARAKDPHPRDRASFLPQLHELLEASGRLVVVDEGAATHDVLGDGWTLHYSEGHTPGLMLAEVDAGGTPVVFAGDLIPGAPWVHLPITMGYDRYPERLIEEKRALLEDLVARGGRLFFTHDADVALAGVDTDERGRFRAVDPAGELFGWAGD